MKLVLFVCTGNSDCSQMAQAFVNIHGAGNVQAFSAGSRPSGKVSPRAIAAMAELGYDLYSHRSKGLDEFNGMTIDYAVTMDVPMHVLLCGQRAKSTGRYLILGTWRNWNSGSCVI